MCHVYSTCIYVHEHIGIFQGIKQSRNEYLTSFPKVCGFNVYLKIGPVVHMLLVKEFKLKSWLK